MAGKDNKRYWGRLQQLQKEHLDARKSGDFALAKKKKEEIRQAASEPFDNYIQRLENVPGKNISINQQPESFQIEDQELPGQQANEEGAEFGQPVDRVRQQEVRSAGQQQADLAQQKALGQEQKISPAKEPPPGGPALSPSKTPNTPKPTVGAQPESRASSVVQKGTDRAKQVADQAVQYLKKAVAQFAKRAIASFFASPWGWPVTAVILGLIVLGIIVLIFIAIVYGGHSTVSTTGSTITRPTDPLSDKEWIKKLLLMGGDNEIGSKVSLDLLQGLETNLTSLEAETPLPPQATETIASIRTTITTLKGLLNKTDADSKKQRTDLCNKLVEDFKKLDGYLRNNAPAYTGTNRWPIPASIGVGFSPHGRSPYWIEEQNGKWIALPNPEKKNHDVAGGFGNKGICDALDITVPENSHPDVFPIFDGKIISKRKLTNQSHDVVVVADSSGNYKALYTDIQTTKNVGDAVTTSQPFAKVSARTVAHIQVSYQDSCLVTTAAEVDQYKNNKPGKPSTYGSYMQAHIQAVFNNFAK